MQLANKFKIRCSAIGDIMTEPRSKSETLSATCLAYVHKWILSQPEFFDKEKHFRSKYTTKGNECEQAGIDLASRVFGWGLVEKNKEWRENEYITGTPDIVLARSIEDIKNAWSQDSFPFFAKEYPTKYKQYEWQGDGYMDLWDKEEFGLVFTLNDAPERLIEREARVRAWDMGYEDVPADLFDLVKEEMTYSQYRDEIRVKRFEIYRDEKRIERVYERVEDIRKYINNL